MAAAAPWMAWRKRMAMRSKGEETEKSGMAESCRSSKTGEEEAPVDGSGSSIVAICTGPFSGSNSYGESAESSNPQNMKAKKKSSKRGGGNGGGMASKSGGGGGGPAYICCNNLKSVVHGNTRVVHRGDQDSPLSLSFSPAADSSSTRPATPVVVHHVDDDDWSTSVKDSVFFRTRRTKLSAGSGSCYDCSSSLSCEPQPTDFLRHCDGGSGTTTARYQSLQLLQPARHSFSHPPTASSSSSSASSAAKVGGHAYGCCSAEDHHGSAHCYLQLQHHAPNHSVRELREGDSARSIVEIIFQTSWPAARRHPDNYYSSSVSTSTRVRIESMFKVHSSSRALARFEEHRDMVKAKASRMAAAAASSRRNSSCRCLVDGNEQLRFHATTATCDLGRHLGAGSASLCTAASCGVCAILRHGFPMNGAAGIRTNASSGRAHAAGGGGGGGGRRWRWAMLVCRVIAGRVKRVEEGEEICSSMVGVDGGVYDSVAAGGGGGREAAEAVEDLVVFNPRAVLPCFVVLYAAGGGGGEGGG